MAKGSGFIAAVVFVLATLIKIGRLGLNSDLNAP